MQPAPCQCSWEWPSGCEPRHPVGRARGSSRLLALPARVCGAKQWVEDTPLLSGPKALPFKDRFLVLSLRKVPDSGAAELAAGRTPASSAWRLMLEDSSVMMPRVSEGAACGADCAGLAFTVCPADSGQCCPHGKPRGAASPTCPASQSVHRGLAGALSRCPGDWGYHGGPRRLTERVRSEGVGRRLLLFGLQVGEARSRGVRGEAVRGRLACRGVQRQGWRWRRRWLHEQGLGQLALVLLDLLLQVIDCACHLRVRHTLRPRKGQCVLSTKSALSPLLRP